MGNTMRDAAVAKSDAVDDAFILAVGRAAQTNGITVQFDEVVMDGDEMVVGVSIKTTMKVPSDATVAHGRRLALAALLE
jgi:hypothetical protein